MLKRLLLALLCLSGLALAQTASHHTDPVSLNELALKKLARGEVSSAHLLLERAVRLAPYDERIRNNLAVLEAAIHDRNTQIDSIGSAPSSTLSTSPEKEPDLPAIWPKPETNRSR